MELPIEIKEYIESLLMGEKGSPLKEVSLSMSDRYLKGEDTFIKNELEAKVYASIRMPATYSAVSEALENTLLLFKEKVESVIDVGSGTGASTLVSFNLISPKEITCFEKNQYMRDVASLVLNNSELKGKYILKSFDLVKDNLDIKSDLVVSSYVLNELSVTERINAINKMWDATNKLLLIVEPGTLKGFSIIKEIREYLVNDGGHIVAPCPHMGECPLNENNWCHFKVRVARSRLHKLLKGGEAPYEDENYSYIAISKTKVDTCENRVVRHPIINKGMVNLEVCSSEGIKKLTIRKSEKEKYKLARKVKIGESI